MKYSVIQHNEKITLTNVVRTQRPPTAPQPAPSAQKSKSSHEWNDSESNEVLKSDVKNESEEDTRVMLAT